jgi:acetylglutamate kinase
VNPQLVARINAYGPFAAGLSGEDAGSSADAAAAS